MAPAPLPQDWSSRPSLNAAVVALFLAKSKPAQASVKDYIRSLRAFIQRGKRPEMTDKGEQFLDTVAYWRDAYRKSQQVENQLRAQILTLEQKLEPHCLTIGQTTPNTANSQRKRKWPAATTAEPLTGSTMKRAKAAHASNPNSLLPLVLNYDEDLTPNSEVNTLLERISVFQQTMRDNGKTAATPDDLAYFIIQSTADIRHLISSMPTRASLGLGPRPKALKALTRIQEQQQLQQFQNQIKSDARLKCLTIAGIFPYILRVQAMLAEIPESDSLYAQVIHCVVSVFRDLLEHICTLSAHQVLQKQPITTSKKKSRLLAETQDYLSPPAKVTTNQEDGDVVVKLCQLAIAMMGVLDRTIPAQNEIFEGFLYMLLTRVGESLSYFVFDSEQQVKSPDALAGDSKASYVAQSSYLLYLLKQATAITTKQPTHDTSSNSSYNTIVGKAKTQLQNTLLKAIFGEHALEFADSLQKPIDPDCQFESDVHAQESGQAKISKADWFKNKVWQMVGWDVLHEMIQWT